MKLSGIGKSAIIVAGVTVLALAWLQVINPVFFENFNELAQVSLLNLPVLVMSSIASIVFLTKTKKMNRADREPWEFYSWFVLPFTSIVVIIYLVRAIFFMFGKPSEGFEWFLLVPMLITFIFIFVGLGYEKNRPATREVKDVIWIFVSVCVALVLLVSYTPLKNITHFSTSVAITIICLVPIYFSISIIRKNVGQIRDIYTIILISQILFYLFGMSTILTENSMLDSLGITVLFLAFAIAFDLRTSLYLLVESKTTEIANVVQESSEVK